MMMIQIKPNYLIIPGVALLVSMTGRLFSDIGMASWYQTIKTPSFTPPGWLVSSVWQLIFVLTTAAALIVWNKFERGISFFIIMILFCVNAFLNVHWSFVFFYMQKIDHAFWNALLLSIVTIVLMIMIIRHSKFTGLLLLPYAVWSVFATYLNFAIAFMNNVNLF